MPNRLAQSLSPYLRQHADNPVEWFEWGEEAFAEARRRDVPILLSVGYAACHWCHVMAHESLEDTGIAERMNAEFVCIKVDREERPDIDAVYMAVTQALTGQGGWPMTVILTPKREPIFAGTYFPPARFDQVLRAIAGIWRDDRPRAEATAASIVSAMRQGLNAPAGVTTEPGLAGDNVPQPDLTRAIDQLVAQYDTQHDGFGSAPKFPPSMTLEHLLRHHARTGDERALEMARATCHAMARGGMYDQLDGGFARYSVDAGWVVPHFEKMLYDNAQLLPVYTHLWRQTGDELAERVATQTAEFMLHRLRTPEGAFASALDADADGVEGSTYVWTPQQLRDVLGETDGTTAARLLTVTPAGTFENGASTLQLRRDPDAAGGPGWPWWDRVRVALLAARANRPQPARDDKVVASWNGLAIAGLAEAAMIFTRPEWLDAAEAAAAHVWQTHWVDGRLRRVSLDGQVSEASGTSDDYGNLALAFGTLHQATGRAEYLQRAVALLDRARELFVTDGRVYDTAADAEELFVRPQSQGDNAEPSGASALAGASVMLFALTSQPKYRDFAVQCLGALGEVTGANPRFAGWALATWEALADGPRQVAITCDASADSNDVGADLTRAAWLSNAPGLVRVVGEPDAPGVPLLAGRSLASGRAQAYVCRGFVCDTPTANVDELRRQLG